MIGDEMKKEIIEAIGYALYRAAFFTGLSVFAILVTIKRSIKEAME